MKTNYIVALTLLGSFSAYGQGAAPAPAEKVAEANEKTSLQKIADIKAKMDARYKEFSTKLRAIKDNKKHRDFYNKNRPDFSAEYRKVLALAKADPSAEGMDKQIGFFYRGFDQEDKAAALDMMLKHHKGSDALVNIVRTLSYQPNGAADLRKIAELSTNLSAKSFALFNVAKKDAENPATKDAAVASIKKLIASAELKEKNPNLHKMIKSELFVIENLSIGSAAPDIVGNDQDDKEFKLSDYKGKVVLLDFWGIW